MNKAYDAAVIGGGVAGLIAAIEMARAGLRIVLAERSSRLGGRAITVNKNGALFNMGGHAIYQAGEAYTILREMGVKLEGGSPGTDGLAIWRGALAPLPGNPAQLLTSRLLSWRGKLELGQLMMGLGKRDPDGCGNVSLRDWSEREIRDPMVRHIWYALCRTSTYGSDIDYQRVGPVLRQVQRSLSGGVLYLHGGWQSIVDQLRELAVRSGVYVTTGSAVKEIVRQNGTVRGLLLANGETISTDRVVSALGPVETHRLVPDSDQTALARWKNEARPTMAACLDLCLKKLPVPGRYFAIGLDQPIFFTHHSRAAKLSDDGSEMMHLIKYNGTGGSDPQADEQQLEQTMDLLHPGWRSELVARQYLPNIVVAHDSMHLGRSVPLTGPGVPEIPGLYVAGDWASHGELLLDAAAASARRAALQLIQDRRGAATTASSGFASAAGSI